MENWRRHIAKTEFPEADPRAAELGLASPGYRHGDLRVIVKSVAPLAPEVVAALAAKLRRAYQREVLIEVELDPSLVGGLLITIGHRVIDMSVAGHLRQLSLHISNNLEKRMKDMAKAWETPLAADVEGLVHAISERVLATEAAKPSIAAGGPVCESW